MSIVLPLLALGISVHTLACLCHGLGVGQSFWARKEDYVDAGTSSAYTRAVLAIISQLHGVSSLELASCWEMLFAICVSVVGILFVVIYLGMLASTGDRDSSKLSRLCRQYLQDHSISNDFALRLRKHLSAQADSGICANLEKENQFIKSLPLAIQAELCERTRCELLCVSTFFADFREMGPTTFRRICHQAIVANATLADETCFHSCDSCTVMRFVEKGQLLYFPNVGKERRVSSSTVLSEAALWVKWNHCGTLVACQDSVVLELHEEIFSRLVCKNQGAFMHSVRYAKRFLQKLSRTEHLSDILPDGLDELEMACDVKEHFIFLSHFKLEAGTEATLLAESLTSMIREDPGHSYCDVATPIFIDSETLFDLKKLRPTVRNGQNLVLLLTPQVLTRPWCLVEIVEAMLNAQSVVPVEVQRPGAAFKYPEESFYADLRDGKVLDSQGMSILLQEKISLKDVEEALRKLFRLIASPYSPHKTINVRHAEMQDILSRCRVD